MLQVSYNHNNTIYSNMISDSDSSLSGNLDNNNNNNNKLSHDKNDNNNHNVKSGLKRHRDQEESEEDTKDVKAEKRKIANRKASVACRLRKKIFINELQRQVVELTQKNLIYEKENEVLRQMLNDKLRLQQLQQQEMRLQQSMNSLSLPAYKNNYRGTSSSSSVLKAVYNNNQMINHHNHTINDTLGMRGLQQQQSVDRDDDLYALIQQQRQQEQVIPGISSDGLLKSSYDVLIDNALQRYRRESGAAQFL